MNRPTGWKPNPQAMAAVSRQTEFTGNEELRSHFSDTDTWLTPRYILDSLGKFDLDPCAAQSNPFWVCGAVRTVEENGLSDIPWEGRVFMNPPFSETAAWIRRHSLHGSGITLVPASVESRIWREAVWPRATAILLLHGRTRFCNPDGSTTTGRPLRSIALIAWSDYDAEFLDKSLAGVLLREWRQS